MLVFIFLVLLSLKGVTGRGYDKYVDRGLENKKFIKFKYFNFLKVIQVSQGNIKFCREDGQQTYPQ